MFESNGWYIMPLVKVENASEKQKRKRRGLNDLTKQG